MYPDKPRAVANMKLLTAKKIFCHHRVALKYFPHLFPPSRMNSRFSSVVRGGIHLMLGVQINFLLPKRESCAEEFFRRSRMEIVCWSFCLNWVSISSSYSPWKFWDCFSVFKVKISSAKSLTPIFASRASRCSAINHLSDVYLELERGYRIPNMLLIKSSFCRLCYSLVYPASWKRGCVGASKSRKDR